MATYTIELSCGYRIDGNIYDREAAIILCWREAKQRGKVCIVYLDTDRPFLRDTVADCDGHGRLTEYR